MGETAADDRQGSCIIQNIHIRVEGPVAVAYRWTDRIVYHSIRRRSVMDTDGRGNLIELARLSSKDCFGEMSLLTGEPRSPTTKALTNVDAINVPKEAIEPIIHQKPELSETQGRIMAERRHSKEVFAVADSKEEEKPVKSYVRMIRAFFGLGSV